MASTVNAAVLKYLKEQYPDVACIFQREGSISKRHLSNGASVESLIVSQQNGVKRQRQNSLSDNEQSVQKKSRIERKSAVPDSSSDDDDDAPVRKPLTKGKGSPAVKPAPKKAAVPDSSSDDDDDAPVRKPLTKGKGSPAVKPAPKKAAVPDSSSDDDKDERPVTKRMHESNGNGKEESLNKRARTEKADELTGSNQNCSDGGYGGRNKKNGGNVVRRFQRIDPTKVVFLKDELRDNRPGDAHMGFRQNQEMMRVKGKDFNKLKQKNKAKFYAAGVDTTVRAFQFDDSD